MTATLWSAAVFRRFGGKRESPSALSYDADLRAAEHPPSPSRLPLEVRVCDGLWRGRPPHSTTQAKLCAANDVPCHSLKAPPILRVIPTPENHVLVFKLLGMARYPADDSSVPARDLRIFATRFPSPA